MCLAIPARVKSVEGYEVEAEVGGIGRRASIVLTPEVKVGDYVLLHTGYAINVIDEEEAEETLKLFEEIAEADTQHNLSSPKGLPYFKMTQIVDVLLK